MQSANSDPLKPAVVEKILGLGSNESVNRGFLDLFRAMASEGNIDGAPAKTIVLTLYDASCALEPGDWAPEIHLVTRKVESVGQPEETEEGRGLQAVRRPDDNSEVVPDGRD